MSGTEVRNTQQEHSEEALARRKAAPKPNRPETHSAGEGIRPLPNEDIAPEGALDAEGAKPALERSKKAR